MEVNQAQYAAFLKFQAAQASKLDSSKRWNARLRILASKALEAGFSVTDEEIHEWINAKREINL